MWTVIGAILDASMRRPLAHDSTRRILMINMFAQCRWMVVVAAACALIADAAGDSVDRSSFHYLLSHYFSSVTQQDGLSIEVKLMDTPVSPTVSRSGHVERCQVVEPFSSFRIAMGDSLEFGVVSGDGGLTVTVTNGIHGLEGIELPDPFSRSSMLVVFDEVSARHENLRQDRSLIHRTFVADVPGGGLYDVEKKAGSAFRLPFRALWKDWDDFMENFSEVPRVDFVKSSHESAKIFRAKAEKSETLRTFCRGLTNDAFHVVRYCAEGDCKYFALVGKRGEAIDVKGVGEVLPDGGFRAYMLDERGCLRWIREYVPWGGGRELNNEFDNSGAVRRFTEIDGHGTELRRRFRRLKEERMVVPEARAAFLAEAEEVVRPFTMAWKDNNYAIVPNIPPPSAEDARRIAAVEVERMKREQRQRDRYARVNVERRAAGLPELTELEKRRIARDEMLQLRQKRFERLRHERTGRCETTEMDAAVDKERARLDFLSRIVSEKYSVAIRAIDVRPKSLRELLGVKFPPRGQFPLLLEGEKDIRDLWGREYRYCSGEGTDTPYGEKHPIITSAGPDGMFDTSDDISSIDIINLENWKTTRNREIGE